MATGKGMAVASRLVLGVDLDGVCADYEGAFRRAVARQLDRDPSTLGPQTTMDAYVEWGLDATSFEEAHRRAVVEDRIFRNMQPLPDAAASLWRLSDQGVWIRIITNRLLFNGIHEISASDTAWWLDAHGFPYRDLCFIGDKPDVGAGVYVDDSPDNVARLRAAGRATIVFDQPYNRHLTTPRAGRWADVVGYVERLLRSHDRQLPPPLEDHDR